MKPFLKNTLVVISVVLGLLISIVLILGPTQKNPEMQYKYWYMENNREAIKTLLLGHSHMANSFNPYELDSAFSLAISGRISYYDAQLVARYVPSMHNLKAIVFPLAYEHEAGRAYLDEEFLRQMRYEYKRYMKLDYPQEYQGTMYELEYIKKYLRRSITWKAYQSSFDCDSLGYVTLNNEVSNRINVFQASNSDVHVTESLSLMAKVCAKYGIRLIVVSFPVNSTFMEKNVTQSGLDSLYTIVNTANVNEAIEYKCYYGDSEYANDSLFYDQTHLNHRGATLFAQRVKKDFGL